MNVKIIGIGNKARHGKDTVASLLYAALPNSKIISFAKNLKNEVSLEAEMPLIFVKLYDNKIIYFLRDTITTYKAFYHYEVPKLHKIFTERDIIEYPRMCDKDSEILQFWGTDFRRSFNKDYWVNSLHNDIKKCKDENPSLKYVIIPDVRFENEYNYIKSNGGLYINVIRLNEDNTLYKDPSRDSQHQSEIELDGYKADLKIVAQSGNIQMLEKRIIDILRLI